MSDPNSKTIRHFRCRDYLWETFEEMGRELGCSTDYLINEAMRLYARSREYGTQNPSIAPHPPPGPPPPSGSAPATAEPRPGKSASSTSGISPAARAAGPPVPAPVAPPPPTRSSYMPPPPGGPGLRPPSAPSTTTSFERGPRNAVRETVSGHVTAPLELEAPRATMLRQGAVAPPLGRASLPAVPPAPITGGGLPDTSPRLTLLFQGERIPVDKAEFVIGRGSKSSDLAIKDGNISRRHAAIVFDRGAYWLRDLGSTNGIEHAGRRIEQKRIEEGDVFQVCDYELRFTFR